MVKNCKLEKKHVNGEKQPCNSREEKNENNMTKKILVEMDLMESTGREQILV